MTTIMIMDRRFFTGDEILRRLLAPGLSLGLPREAIAFYVPGFNYLLNYWCSPLAGAYLLGSCAQEFKPRAFLASEPGKIRPGSAASLLF